MKKKDYFVNIGALLFLVVIFISAIFFSDSIKNNFASIFSSTVIPDKVVTCERCTLDVSGTYSYIGKVDGFSSWFNETKQFSISSYLNGQSYTVRDSNSPIFIRNDISVNGFYNTRYYPEASNCSIEQKNLICPVSPVEGCYCGGGRVAPDISWDSNELLCLPENTQNNSTTNNILPFSGGKGTVSDPYQISNWTELNNVRNYLTADAKVRSPYFKLIADLSTSTVGYVGIGDNWQPIGPGTGFAKHFAGVFDGNGKTISDLTINKPEENYVGLFAFNNGIISNLGLINANITGRSFVGGLAGVSGKRQNGLSSDGTINNSYSTGKVNGGGNGTGGLVGNLGNSIINNSYSAAQVTVVQTPGLTVPRGAGGLVGGNDGTINNSYSTGKVVGPYSNFPMEYGGLVGQCSNGKVSNSFWDIETSGKATSGCGIGTVGKTTAQMKDPGTYNGWDYSVWDIFTGDYPIFFTKCDNFTTKKIDIISSALQQWAPYTGGYENKKQFPLVTPSIAPEDILQVDLLKIRSGASYSEWYSWQEYGRTGTHYFPCKDPKYNYCIGNLNLPVENDNGKNRWVEIGIILKANEAQPVIYPGPFPRVSDLPIIVSTSSAAITSFSFTNPSLRGIVNEDHKVIYVPTPDNTDLSVLTPVINVSSGSTVSPLSGQVQSFEKGTKTYTVTAKDGSSQDYTVVISGLNSDTSIESFSLTNSSTGEINGSIDTEKKTVSVSYNDLINDFKFIPKIKLANENAVIFPASDIEQDFSSPVVYTVTAKDGITRTNYTVTFINPRNSEKEITTAVFGLYKKPEDRYNRMYNGSAEISRTEIWKGGVGGYLEITNYIKFHIPFGYYQSYIDYYIRPSQELGISKYAEVSTYLDSQTGWVNPAGEYYISVNDYPIDYVVTAQDGSQQTYIVSVVIDPPVFGMDQIGQYCGVSACGDKNTQLNQAGIETLANPQIDTIQVGPYRQFAEGRASVVSCPENTNYDVCVENQNDGLGNYVLLGVKYQTYLSISAHPTFVEKGSPTKIAWAVSNMDNCIASGGSAGWSGNLSSSVGPHSWVISPLTTNGTITYNISCTGASGVISKSVDVYVKDFTEVSNWTQLNNIRNNPSSNYILTANLSSATAGYAGIGDSWVPIPNFSGTLNGNNKIIANLAGESLFGTLSGNISNLGLVSINNSRAAFAKAKTGGIIIDSYATGNITNPFIQMIGGLVAEQSGGLISRSYFDGNINRTSKTNDSFGSGGIGGLVGEVSEGGGDIINSYMRGNIIVSATAINGGLVGISNPGSSIVNSYFLGSNASPHVNHLSAINLGQLINSYMGPAVTDGPFKPGEQSRSTVELLTPSTYKNWTPDIWDMFIGQYPVLKSYVSLP